MAGCERIAKICSLLPETGSDARAAYKLADSALRLGSNNKEFLPWAQMTMGIAEYRAGRFSEAIEWLQKSLADDTAPGTLKVTAYAALGMAQQRSRHPTEARAALAEAAELLGNAFAQPEGTPPDMKKGMWHDWLIGRVILREAQVEIMGASARKPKK